MKTKWILLCNLLIISSFFTVARAEYYVVYTSQPLGSSCCRSGCQAPCDPMGCCAHLVPVEKSEYNEEEYQWIDP